MKKLILSAALVALTAGGGQAQTIRMGTEGAYPPFNFINDKGEIDGFERDLGDELCKRAGLTCEWVQNDWASIIPNLQAGTYDTIIAGMSITEDRDKVIDFTQNYIPATSSAYLAASPDADTGGTIAVQAGTIEAGYVEKSGAALLAVASQNETIAAVRRGEADAAFAAKDYLAPVAEESGGALVLLEQEVQLGGGVGMGLRESDKDLRARFDRAIGEMKADGTLNAMIRKWFGGKAATF